METLATTSPVESLLASWLTPEELASLDVFEWSEEISSVRPWNFKWSTVARYSNGSICYRLHPEVELENVLAHEVGHHVSIHPSGRLHKHWLGAFRARSGNVEWARGLAEGFADGFSESVGETPNPWYEERAQAEADFGDGYRLGLTISRVALR